MFINKICHATNQNRKGDFAENIVTEREVKLMQDFNEHTTTVTLLLL